MKNINTLPNCTQNIQIMKKRIFQKWSLQRILFAIAGSGLILFSIIKYAPAGILLGLYFMAMGILDVGCAAGMCHSGSCTYDPSTNKKTM